MQVEYPNWFNHTAKGNFEKFLTPLAGQDDLHFLQLGVYTGDASVWLAENILTGKNSWLIDVDTWAGSDEDAHKSMDFDDVYEVYKTKTEMYKTIKHFKSTTTWHLSSVRREPCYDFIYIDASHQYEDVYTDLSMAYNYFPDAFICGDDWGWRNRSQGKRMTVQEAVKEFCKNNNLKVKDFLENIIKEKLN
jgi:hypothetical protein